MKAMRYGGYGSADRIRCEEVERPVPADDEVLIEVRAASVNAPDSLAEVPQAVRYLDEGHARGKVVIAVS